MKHRSQAGRTARGVMVAAVISGVLLPVVAPRLPLQADTQRVGHVARLLQGPLRADLGRTEVALSRHRAGRDHRDREEKRLGNQAFTHVHHYCASLVYSQRAGVARSGQERKQLLRQAEGDCELHAQAHASHEPDLPRGRETMPDGRRGAVLGAVAHPAPAIPTGPRCRSGSCWSPSTSRHCRAAPASIAPWPSRDILVRHGWDVTVLTVTPGAYPRQSRRQQRVDP